MGKGIRQYHNWLIFSRFHRWKSNILFFIDFRGTSKKKLDKEKYQQENFFIQKKIDVVLSKQQQQQQQNSIIFWR